MKRLLFFPLLLFLVPASAQAYSFETARMEQFRDEVRSIVRDRNTPTGKAAKAELVSFVQAASQATKTSFVPVRDTEVARLDKILTDRLQAAREQSAKSKTKLLVALNKSCTRQKRGSSEAKQKIIEARCVKRRAAISEGVAAKLAATEAAIQKRFGASSQPRQSLEARYNQAIEAVNELAEESVASINDRPLPVFVISVTLAGTGSGTVVSSPTGISCGLDCAGSYSEDAVVTLTAAPAAGSQFAGWSGATGCSSATTCSITVRQAQTVTATFNTAS